MYQHSPGLSGDNLIKDVTLEIGGQQIDKHTRIPGMAELPPDPKAAVYNTWSSNFVTGGEKTTVNYGPHFTSAATRPLYPIALQYEVKVKFTWELSS